jgi:hypothetical protein
MTITLSAYSGTETVSTTEHSMTTDSAGPDADTTAGVYQAFIDFNAVAAGDEFQFAVYEKVLDASATQRQVFKATVANAQSSPAYVSSTFVLGIGWDMTLLKIGGTDRSITWRIAKVA